MRRALLALSVLAVALLALPAGQAFARKSAPSIKRVSPMRVKVGSKLSLRGRGFSRRRKRNTVVFKAASGRVAFAKARRASRKKIVIVVPGSLENLLDKKGGKPAPTRFRMRVIAGKLGKYTPKRISPVVVSSKGSGKADCDNDGVANSKDADDDNDLMSDGRERGLKTDPCLADTDGDGVEDGFEVESALDLNQRAVPYPGKRPYPNALDPSDAAKDYDGDGMTNKEEYGAWAHAAASPAPSLLQGYYSGADAPVFSGPYDDRPRFGGHTFPLNYSDGDQTTVPVHTGDAEYHWYLDRDGNGSLEDDERDADGDGLGNVDELRLLMYQPYYTALDETTCAGYEYKPWLERDFAPVDYLDWDTDGDGVWDGNDDQDNDDVANVDEILPPFKRCGTPPKDYGPFPVGGTPDGQPRVRQPFNPCAPYRSRTCARYFPRQ